MCSFIRMTTKLTLIRATSNLQQHNHTKESKENEWMTITSAYVRSEFWQQHAREKQPQENCRIIFFESEISLLLLGLSLAQKNRARYCTSGDCGVRNEATLS